MRAPKDTPLRLPLAIFSPGRFADRGWGELLAWYVLALAAVSQEPDPTGLGIRFHWAYLVQGHLVALVVHLLLPFLLLPFSPSATRVGLVKIALGSSLVWLWTSPLAWIASGPLGGIALSLGREALWATLVVVGAGLRPSKTWRGIDLPALVRIYHALKLVALVALITALSVGLQSIPDLVQSRGLRMDNIRSGRIASGTPDLPSGFLVKARWTLQGPPDLLSPERLVLGARQIVVHQAPGHLVVEVAPGDVPSPSDTVGSRALSPQEGDLLDALLRDIPADEPDSLRILRLHAAVHTSIRYERSYFPGNCDAILKRGSGDCKAFSQLMTEGARRMGFRARQVRGLLASPDGYYAHAWTSVELDGRWSDWDPTSAMPFPDARYLRFSMPEQATGAFDGELGIFALDSVHIQPLETHP